MTDEPRVELGERTLGPLLADSLRIYGRNLRTFLAIGLAVVIPADLIVAGVGMGQLGAGYDEEPELPAQVVLLVAHLLVTTPLVAAMATYALLDLAGGRRPGARQSIQRGLDVFRPVFWPVLIAIAVETLATGVLVVPLGFAVGSALVPTLLIPLALYVRWYFVPQVVVVEKTGGTDALRSSWRLTRGSGFRVFGILFLAMLLIGIAAQVLATPLLAAAQGADSGALLMLYQAVSQAIASPAVGVLGALLYFDLRSRRRAVA